VNIKRLDEDALSLLVEDLEDLNHDLGKYIVFETRMLSEGEAGEALAAALRSDLHSTRKGAGPDGGFIVESAWAVWSRLRPAAIEDAHEVCRIDKLMSELQCAELDGPDTVLHGVREQAREVRTLLKALLLRARAEEGGR
jgi:hypothetical protein